MTSPKISIIVPVYNNGQYIAQCLDSLVGQTFGDIEIICVDDGSTDDTPSVLDAYLRKDARIKIIRQDNTGPSGARNRGLREAGGSYVMFVDGDDWVDAVMCEELYRAAVKENADCVMCSYVSEFIDGPAVKRIFEGEYLSLDQQETKRKVHRRLFGLVGDELSKPEECDLLVSACMQLFRRSLVSSIQFVDTKRIGTEDVLFQIETYARCGRFVYIGKPFYHYRKTNASSLTSTHKPDLFEKWQTLYELMEQFALEHCNEADYFEALENRIALSMIGLGLNELCAKSKSALAKAGRLRDILNYPRYRTAFGRFSFQYLPAHWKIFFLLCKYKKTLCLVVMLRMVNYLRIKRRLWNR